ncbi:MAG: stage II sporulation protein M [Deltaproteobacteria bacterium]|nr:stage II sporulation protein M [Deltaproteobacteria bacterium]
MTGRLFDRRRRPEPGDAPRGEAEALTLRSAQFRRGREESWARLQKLIDKLDAKGAKALDAAEAMELPKLYQAAVSSLAVARNTILDRNLVEHLESLCLQAYLAVYGPRRGLGECLSSFLRRSWPQSVRALKREILAAALLFFVAAAAGLIMVRSDQSAYNLLVPPEIAQGRNYLSSAEELSREGLFAPWSGFESSFIHFANFLFRNNFTVCLLCFGLGVAAGVPTALLLLANGLTVGAFLALHLDKGLGLDFVAWLSIHGTTEITAVILAGAAGLGFGAKLVFPGGRSRSAALADYGRRSAGLMAGVTLLLLTASFLESGLRQLAASTPLRLALGLAAGAAWWSYFALTGRETDGREPDGREPSGTEIERRVGR